MAEKQVFYEPQWASPWFSGKGSTCGAVDGVRSLGREDPLEEEMVSHSSILAQRIPRTEGPGGLQSMGPKELARLSNWTTITSLIKYFICKTAYILAGEQLHSAPLRVPNGGLMGKPWHAAGLVLVLWSSWTTGAWEASEALLQDHFSLSSMTAG